MSGRARGTILLVALGCSSQSDTPPVARSALPAGAVARVGDENVSTAAVKRIADSQGIAPRDALSHALRDASLAQAARASAPTGVVPSIERAAVARTLLESMGAEAERAGPATAAETAELLDERWADLKRPDAVVVTHAVVMNVAPVRDQEARRAAEQLLSAVTGASNADDFIARATAMPARGFEIRAESLPAVTADGRTFDKREKGYAGLNAHFDVDFARAANALSQPGQLSPVVKSAFGWHVLRLEARVPASNVPAAELAALVTAETRIRRAARLRGELLEKLRTPGRVQLERAVDELTARLKTSP